MHLFDGKKFYDVAMQLITLSEEEHFQRSAIGRLYYACFWESRKYYEKAFRTHLPFNHSHQVLINALRESNYEIEQELGQSLNRLRQYRVHADYKDKAMRRNMLRNSKETTGEILGILEELRNNPVRKFI